MGVYVVEDFSEDEADVLRRYFTNLDQPVFALVNLPEVVKGALFARYSRSSKSLRRLFLDELVAELDIEGDTSIDATIGLDRAEELHLHACVVGAAERAEGTRAPVDGLGRLVEGRPLGEGPTRRRDQIPGQVTEGMDAVDKIKRGEGQNGQVQDPDKIIKMQMAADAN